MQDSFPGGRRVDKKQWIPFRERFNKKKGKKKKLKLLYKAYSHEGSMLIKTMDSFQGKVVLRKKRRIIQKFPRGGKLIKTEDSF